MADFTKEQLEQIKHAIGFDESGEHAKKTAAIVHDKKQFTVRIPKKFADAMQIDEEKDSFEFHLIPDKDDPQKFNLTGVLVKG